MISKRFTAMILIALVAVFSLQISAQTVDGRGPGNGNGNGDGSGPQYFDIDTVKTLSGTLKDVNSDWVAKGDGNYTGTGMHFVFNAGGTDYELILGPAQFLTDNGISLAVGQNVTVTGSVVDSYVSSFSNQFIIATKITANGTTLEIRDANGYPLWRGSNNGGANGRGPGQGPQGQNYFDSATVKTLSGTLVEVLDYWTANGNGNSTGAGMHYVFKAGGTSYYLMAGPFWFMENNGVVLEKGMNISVTGSVVDAYDSSLNQYDYLIAQSITVNGTTAELRDAEGYPLWRSGNQGDYNCPNYNTTSTTVVAGEVTAVRYRSYGAQVDTGMEIMVRANGKRYRTYLAPLYYCEGENVNLQVGQTVRVRGSLVDGEIVTRNLTTSTGKRYTFRKVNGSPLWQQ